MNVVQRQNNIKIVSNGRKGFIRKDSTLGIRGSSALLPIKAWNSGPPLNSCSKTPRYQFENGEPSSKVKRYSMGPPLQPPRSTKRRTTESSSARCESSSGSIRPVVLASDSAVADTSNEFCTPRNRPTALRYISSSSRGGHSGTRSARSMSNSVVEASVILAISEGRGQARGEIGMAAVDLRHPHLVLCQFSDTLLYTHTLTKINYFNPIEIIVPNTFCEGTQPNQLYQLIKDHFPMITLSTVLRKHYNDAAGRQHIQTLCAPQYNAVYMQVVHKFYALTAAAAVLKYVEYIQCIVFARESLKIEYHSSENTTIIDVGTATQLELVQPLVPSAGPTCCLLGVLGPTYTIGGIRALRASILQPSCKKEYIEMRLDAVQDLIENDDGLMSGLQDIIKKLTDIDKILFLCMESPLQNINKFGEAQLNQVLLLKTTMELVPKLIEALQVANSGRLKKIKIDFENPHYKDISDRIHNIIQEDAHLEKGAMGSLQRCFAVKPDINGLLDVARRTYSELIEDIQKIVEQLAESHDLPLRLNQNVLKGFHIILPLAPKNRRDFKVEDLPDIFIQVRNNGASVSMTTEELVVMDQQAKEALNEIQKMSNIVITGLLKELRPFMSSLYKLCENVAELDIFIALANASTVGSYIRPEFGETLDIKNSVHPLLDYNSQTMPIPNDIYACEEYNFSIITGPNMGGKSIYIKQIAIMQIMAQIGCFLPATSASLRLCDRIFSRIGFNDSVELNASTFVLEMLEIQHILKSLTSSSLIIIDELCRGTSTDEGTSLSWSICEELIHSDAFTFFTTHFMYLTKLQEIYYNVVNLHTSVKEEDVHDTQTPTKRLVYEHKIQNGVTKIKRYGLSLAAKSNLPQITVQLATELADLIAEALMPQEITSPQMKDAKLLYDLNAQIRNFTRKRNSDTNIKHLLLKFKTDNPQLIERLKLEKQLRETEHKKVKHTNKNINNLLSNSDKNTDSLSSIESIRVRPINEIQRIICSTSDDKDTDYDCIRSSDGLLNTMIAGNTSKPAQSVTKQSYTAKSNRSPFNTMETNNSTDEISNTDVSTDFRDPFVRNTKNNTQDQDEPMEYENQNIDDQTDNIETADDLFLNADEETMVLQDFDEEREVHTSNDNNTNMDVNNEDIDFNIAEALTQVIEQRYSGKSNQSDSDCNSVDQELMEETVNEIRRDINEMNVDISANRDIFERTNENIFKETHDLFRGTKSDYRRENNIDFADAINRHMNKMIPNKADGNNLETLNRVTIVGSNEDVEDGFDEIILSPPLEFKDYEDNFML